jgi:predicted metal-dependent hydrolase
MAPLEIIDYIVIHELAHLKIRGHGPDFRELVRQYTPDYRQHEKWLRENAYKLEIGY